MSGITVYNSSNVAQTHLGSWQSSNYSNRDGLAIRQNNVMTPLDAFAFGSHQFGPSNWSTANMNSSSWSSWQPHWYSQTGVVTSDRLLVQVRLGIVYDANYNQIPGFNASCQINLAFGRLNETVPFGFALSEYLTTDSLNGYAGNEEQTFARVFYPLNTSGSSNLSIGEEYKIRVQTRVQPYASMWFRGVQVLIEPI